MIILIFKYNSYFIGGVAKPGQTRRTQDKSRYNDKSRPSGVRGFESHLLHQILSRCHTTEIFIRALKADKINIKCKN